MCVRTAAMGLWLFKHVAHSQHYKEYHALTEARFLVLIAINFVIADDI